MEKEPQCLLRNSKESQLLLRDHEGKQDAVVSYCHSLSCWDLASIHPRDIQANVDAL